MSIPRCEVEGQRPIYILLAEDEPNDQTLFCAAAAKTQLDLRIHAVGNGHEALEYLQGVGLYADRGLYPLPDVLVVDLRMPLMDGFEVLAWCRGSAAFGNLPVVALSGSVDEHWASRALSAGATRFFLKSFRLANWMAMVSDIAQMVRSRASQTQSAAEPELAGIAR